MFLDGAWYPSLWSGCVGIVGDRCGYYVVVYVHEFNDVLANVDPCVVVQQRSSDDTLKECSRERFG